MAAELFSAMTSARVSPTDCFWRSWLSSPASALDGYRPSVAAKISNTAVEMSGHGDPSGKGASDTLGSGGGGLAAAAST
ncbi:MAG: hypothetical protein OEW83_08835 [Acidimicrobiia bacterium]|nr:hypothetical protein [Acidimicrobiia bacterium]